MSGRKSRNKGRRGEYGVRDYLREQGWEADRVPLSGASQGFKGDIRARKDNKEITIEVKVRAGGFDILYALKTPIFVMVDNEPVCLGSTIDEAFIKDGTYVTMEPNHRLVRKLRSLKKLLGGCDILAVKQDRKHLLFIRYGA